MAISNTYAATEYAAFIKTRFPQKEIDSIVDFATPFLREVRKVDDIVGKQTEIPVETDLPQGVGSSLSAMQSTTAGLNQINGSRGVRWAITRAKGYGALTLDGETLMAMKSNDGSWFRNRERETKNKFMAMGQQFETMLWRNGYGSLGQVSADPGTGATCVIASGMIINFHEGMWLDFFANSSGIPSGSARSGGPYFVAAVNYATSTLTLQELSGGSLVAATIDASVGSDDHLVQYGNTSYVAAGTAIKGVPAWIPSADPTDTFFGVARTNYPQKLGGWRQAYLGSIEETVKALDASIRRVNQKPKTLWLSYSNFNRLEQELGARGYRLEDGAEGKFGRPALMMSSPGGGVTVKSGPYVPEDAGYLLDMDTWELHTLGGLPHIVDDDGLTAVRIQSMALGGTAGPEDGIEIRLRWMANLFCTNPFANGRAAIS